MMQWNFPDGLLWNWEVGNKRHYTFILMKTIALIQNILVHRKIFVNLLYFHILINKIFV